MQFSVGRPDQVRAISQRWLLNLWKRGAAGRMLPAWQTIESENLGSSAANLSFLDVIAGPPPRYRVMFHGEMIGKVYGSADCRGRYLDEIVPPQRYPHAEAPYRQVVQTAQPVYTIHDVSDAAGRVVHYERLLLPFGNEAGQVERIAASFEFICADGDFDGRSLMLTQTAPPVLRLSTVIEARATA